VKKTEERKKEKENRNETVEHASLEKKVFD